MLNWFKFTHFSNYVLWKTNVPVPWKVCTKPAWNKWFHCKIFYFPQRRLWLEQKLFHRNNIYFLEIIYIYIPWMKKLFSYLLVNICSVKMSEKKNMQTKFITKISSSPVNWGCRIHGMLLCRGVRTHPNKCPRYDTK